MAGKMNAEGQGTGRTRTSPRIHPAGVVLEQRHGLASSERKGAPPSWAVGGPGCDMKPSFYRSQ